MGQPETAFEPLQPAQESREEVKLRSSAPQRIKRACSVLCQALVEEIEVDCPALEGWDAVKDCFVRMSSAGGYLTRCIAVVQCTCKDDILYSGQDGAIADSRQGMTTELSYNFSTDIRTWRSIHSKVFQPSGVK